MVFNTMIYKDLQNFVYNSCDISLWKSNLMLTWTQSRIIESYLPPYDLCFSWILHSITSTKHRNQAYISSSSLSLNVYIIYHQILQSLSLKYILNPHIFHVNYNHLYHQYLSPDVKSWLTGKDPDAGKDWRQEAKRVTEDEMVESPHWLNGHEFKQTPGDSEGQGNLACHSPQGCKESDIT